MDVYGVEAACQPVPCAAPVGLCLRIAEERDKEEDTKEAGTAVPSSSALLQRVLLDV